jgi:hypothetical protein
VGPKGQVIAIEADVELAGRARSNLNYPQHVQVFAGVGSIASAGIRTNQSILAGCMLKISPFKIVRRS